MADNSYEKVATAINIANCICIVSFVICGAFGYLTFFDETDVSGEGRGRGIKRKEKIGFYVHLHIKKHSHTHF